MMNDIQFSVTQTVILWAIPLLLAITLHEVAHGWMAYKLGDPTAKMLGRLTVNPLQHIDILGTILVPALTWYLGGFLFGWAKPVPINTRHFKSFRRDTALVALAGPLSNLIMAILWREISKAGMVLHAMGEIGIYVNVMLMILNLLPIQPLDGGRIVSSLLPRKLSYYFDYMERFGFILLIFLLMTGTLSIVLKMPFNFITGLIQAL